MSTIEPGSGALNVADGLLTKLHLCEEDRWPFAVRPQSLDGVIPLGMTWETYSGDINEISYIKNRGHPAVWPLDIAVAFWPEDKPSDLTIVHRLRTITTKDARAMGAARFSPTMALHSKLELFDSGKADTGAAPFAFINGSWIPAVTWLPNGLGHDRYVHNLAGLALMMRYEWSVWLGHGSGPRVRFLSDPAGARAAFALRDVPPGRQRRAALRNWVEGHWRKKRRDPEDQAWVKKHLRGATEFEWNDLRCKIQPPDFVEAES
jgi:hypothetical protein